MHATESPRVPLAALQPHFDAILAAPDDDAPRLRLADALDAAGDPRGESIRLGCALERLAPDDPAPAGLSARCAGLALSPVTHPEPQ